MNWIDQVIGFVSPRAGYEREAYRRALEEQRSYDAADHGRLNANWRASIESAEMTDRYGRDIVRARARDMERNSDIMNSVIGAYKRNVFGGGYRLRALVGQNELNKQLEHYWKVWCKKQNCDVTGTQSFNAMMRMAVRRKKVDGGILFLKRYSGGGLVPFKLQALEVDELDLTSISPRHQGNKVAGGIEYDPCNKPVGYWIRQYSIDGMDAIDPVYIPAKDVIFFYTKNRPSQIREISDLTPTITRIRDVNDFMRTVGVKERVLACLSAFIKRALPQSGLGRPGTVGNGSGGHG